MSDTPQAPDWWEASDGRWYPPAASKVESVGPAVSNSGIVSDNVRKQRPTRRQAVIICVIVLAPVGLFSGFAVMNHGNRLKPLVSGTASCFSGPAERFGTLPGPAMQAIGSRRVDLISDGKRLVVRFDLSQELLSSRVGGSTVLAQVRLYTADRPTWDTPRYEMDWSSDNPEDSISSPVPENANLSWFHTVDGKQKIDSVIIRSNRDTQAISLETSRDQLPALPPSFGWTAIITYGDPAGGILTPLSTNTESACGETVSRVVSSADPQPIEFPQQALPQLRSSSITSSPGERSKTSSNAASPINFRALPRLRPFLNSGTGEATPGCTAGVSACGYDNGIDFDALRTDIAKGLVSRYGAPLPLSSDTVNCDDIPAAPPPDHVDLSHQFACKAQTDAGVIWVYVTPNGNGGQSWEAVAFEAAP